jgi:serine/threonine protein kinase
MAGVTEDKNSDLQVVFDIIAEAKKMMIVQHPRIVTVLGILWDSLAIVMEYMPGGTLDKYIADHPNMSWRDRLRCASDICIGMEYLHSPLSTTGAPKMVVFHQDLKTANCLLYRDKKDRLRVKISDFGLSQVSAKNKNGDQVKHVGGTKLYMAPELFTEDEFTKACDVYAYGVVLLELVLRIRPMETFLARCQVARLAIQCQPLQQLLINCLAIDKLVRPSFEFIRTELGTEEIRKARVGKVDIPKDHVPSSTDMTPYFKENVSTSPTTSIKKRASIHSVQSSRFYETNNEPTSVLSSPSGKRIATSGRISRFHTSLLKSNTTASESFRRTFREKRKQAIVGGLLVSIVLCIITGLVVRSVVIKPTSPNINALVIGTMLDNSATPTLL